MRTQLSERTVSLPNAQGLKRDENEKGEQKAMPMVLPTMGAGIKSGNQIASATVTKTTSGTQVASSQPSNVEKLRRGLTNFMNHLNPGAYFVPSPAQLPPAGGKMAPAGLQAEPATIINDGPSADALIKGPNRLVQARPLGGPLRWGRR